MIKPIDAITLNRRAPKVRKDKVFIVDSLHIPPRELHEIALEILQSWRNPYFGAKPYMDAMCDLVRIEDKYGDDSGESVVRYFLSNAQTWRGPTARRVKDELHTILKNLDRSRT